ncbi:helicase [Croceibacterium mercuriale]|uniref:Helicase n=1 Tax=Croceibacterium mercuriale TaxID=1572751 RepID=A0A0B2BZ78_9SPHN|nr:helicase [Croceibacterium mercuriale]
MIVLFPPSDSRLRAVLGPTNTGKTHLAIERMVAHSSGAIGFPLRLLAREVYDRVRVMKGDDKVALITGEERIEPPGARYFLCTAEAMPRDGGGHAFVALDEAQISADRERGHIFTDRLLHARGREETMLLGSATLQPLVRALFPKAEMVERPRFSTLTHIGPRKLSRLPPRSAIVAFSVEQVYQVAEMLRRFRGGAAVVMGALSPETRNRQVQLFQSGEVDYIVATDAIGMGLNLDVTHVAFAGLGKFDGVKQRRLTPAEMAQIAGRAGRHQQDGSFGTLAGSGRGGEPEFTEDEIYAIEQHRFAPLTKLSWRDAQPRTGSVGQLIADLEAKPDRPELTAAPEAIDLGVLKRLADDPDIVSTVRGAGTVRRFWEACQLPDFRQQGVDTHARFVSRLWQDLRGGHLGADFVAARIAELDRTGGDIDTLQGRIAAIRSWAYICQRPDWVLARDEMASRARGVEARLSDALHQRLTERFVNRRTAVLMRGMGKDGGLMKVEADEAGRVLVEGEQIGHLEGFRFVVDGTAGHEDRRLMLAAAEKHLPQLLASRADALIGAELGTVELRDGQVWSGGRAIATLERGRTLSHPRLKLARELSQLEAGQRTRLADALAAWLEAQLAPLAPLRRIEEAAVDPATGTELRAVLLALAAGGGIVARDAAGLQHLPKDRRPLLRRLGVTVGALDLFVPALLKPAPRALLHALAPGGLLNPRMEPVVTGGHGVFTGYRGAARQQIRLDMAERVLRGAFDARAQAGRRPFVLDGALATSMGVQPASLQALLREAGFRSGNPPRALAEGQFGPPAPQRWTWRPVRPGERAGERHGAARPGDRPREQRPQAAAGGNAFAALAGLMP